jgi:3-deoxy-D-manno-octulosonic-acid transferase
MYFIYNLLAVVIVVVVMPLFMIRMLLAGQLQTRFKQMWGFLPADVLAKVTGMNCIWVHAASVGEIVAASSIIKETAKILPNQTFLVSVVTATGYEMAKRIIPEAAGVIYLPLDLPWLVDKVVGMIRPKVFLMVETELWPNFLRSTKKYNVKTLMVNGRISEKSSKRYHYLLNVLKDMLNNIDRFCMQSAQDAQYIMSLGADPSRVVITGNTKYDQTYTDISTRDQTELRSMLDLRNAEPVIIAGSTHKGEEEMLLAAFLDTLARYPQAAMVIAPRHVERAAEIEDICRKAELRVSKRTEGTTGESMQVVILDTIGELGKVYSIADIVFVGGSLVATGGHNILEPAAHGKPVLVGPHMFNFKEIYALLSKRGVCITVKDPKELSTQMVELLENQELRLKMHQEALRIIDENKGASVKSAQYTKELFLQTE